MPDYEGNYYDRNISSTQLNCNFMFNEYCQFIIHHFNNQLLEYGKNSVSIFIKTLLGIVFVVIFLSGVIGNSIVFGVLLKAIRQCKYKPQLQTRRGGLILLLCTVLLANHINFYIDCWRSPSQLGGFSCFLLQFCLI